MKIDLSNQLFQAALPVLNTIESHGYEAYFVGGCVRDTLLALPIHDIDIASNATPDEIQSMFKHTFDVGKEHGTIVVLYQDIPYEVTTFRTEGAYSDFRRPDEVHFVRNLEEDTLRRDFTINALAFDQHGQLYDYHQGLKDLNAKLIRAVGTANERFNEDALRMLRAIRFSSQLGFKIEEQTFNALQHLAPLIENVSIERIRIEISKFFQGDFFHLTGHLLPLTGLCEYIEPFRGINIEQGIKGLETSVEPLIKQGIPREESFVWTLFLYQADSRNEQVNKSLLQTWTHSKQFIRDVQASMSLLKAIDQQDLDARTVYRYPNYIIERIYTYLTVHQNPLADQLMATYQALPIKQRSELQIDGRRIMLTLAMKKGGPLVGKLLDELEELVVTKQLDNREEALLTYVKEHYDETNT